MNADEVTVEKDLYAAYFIMLLFSKMQYEYSVRSSRVLFNETRLGIAEFAKMVISIGSCK